MTEQIEQKPIEERVFEKIKDAAMTHGNFVTQVMYDVKNDDIYIATRASTSEWEQYEDGYCPHAVFTLHDYEGDFDICEIFNYDLQWERDKHPEEFEKEPEFDYKRRMEAIDMCDFEEIVSYDDVISRIEEAQEDYKERFGGNA